MQTIPLSAFLADLAVEDLEISTINNEISQQHETIEDAIANSVYIENVQEVVTNADEISKVGMQSINMAIESIFINLGAPIDKYLNTWCFESLTSDTYSKMALEDMQVFVKDLWTKIKESVNKLWEKVNEFWKNHFSALNKIKVALETALKQVNDNYTRSAQELSDKSDTSIVSSFNNGKSIDQKTISDFVNSHFNMFSTLDELVRNTQHFNKFAKNMRQDDFENEVDGTLTSLTKNFVSRSYRLGTDDAPLITGEFITVEYVQPEESGDIEFMPNVEKMDAADEQKIYLLDKEKLKSIISKTLTIIRETMRYKETQETLQREFNVLTDTFDKHIDEQGIVMDFDDMHHNNSKLLKNYKKTIRVIYRINVSIPKILGTAITSNVKLARSVVHYTQFCLTH